MACHRLFESREREKMTIGKATDHSCIDKSDAQTYTENDLNQAIRKAVSVALSQVLPVRSNLDNSITDLGREGTLMPNTYRHNYEYTDTQGLIRTIKLDGANRKETDQIFQAFIAALLPKPPAPTLIEFVDHSFREAFIENLEETTQVNYTNYLENYIFPYMGRKPMNELTVMDIQCFYDWLAHGSKNGFKKDICKNTINRIGGLLGRILKLRKRCAL